MPTERTGGGVRNIRGEKLSSPLPGLRPVGNRSDPQVELIRGIRGTVKSVEAAAREMTDVVKELRVINERTLRFLETGSTTPGQPSQANPRTMGLTKEDMQAAIAEGLREAMGGDRGPVRPHKVGGRARPGEAVPSDAPSQERLPTGRAVGAEEEATVRREPGRWEGAWQRPRDYDVGKLRQDIAGRVQRMLSERLVEREARPPVVGPLPPAVTQGEFQFEGQVPLPGMEEPTQTQAGGVNTMTAAQAARWMQRSRLLANARNAIGQLAEGGSARSAVASMLPASALKVAGAAGAAIGIADQALGFAEAQRRTNAEWQAVLGGTNAEAFGERARSQLFEWRNRGVLGSGMASQLYSEVARTGMRGSERTQAQDFAVESYRRLGMSIEESMEIVRVASQTGQESLVGVAGALEDVTKAARDAGVNARTARRVFTEGYEAIAQGLGSASAATLAGAAATATARLGRGFEDANLANLFSPQNLQVLAARSGMPFERLYAQTIEGGRGAVNVAQLGQQQLTERAQLTLGQRGFDIARRFREENLLPGRDRLTQAQLDDLQVRLMREARINPIVAQQQLASLGIQVDTNRAVSMLAQVATGELDLGAEAGERYRESRPYTVAPEQRTRQGRLEASLGNIEGVTDLGDVALRAGGDRRGAISGDTGFFAGKTERARNLYLRNVARTGRASPIIERALKEGFDPNWRFRVQGREGDRIVTFDDLMRDYADQAARGDVEIVEGRGAGDTLAGVMQMETQRDVRVTSATSKAVAEKDRGKSAEDWERKQGEGGGRVVIAPSPVLQRYFSFLPEGNAQVDLGPATPTTNPRSRPTGNPTP